MTSDGMPRPFAAGAAARLAAAQQALQAAQAAVGSAPTRGKGASGAPTALAAGQVPPPPDEPDHEPDPRSVAHSIALRLLSVRPHSRVELERKLARRGCDPQVAADVLDRLAEVRLIDDAAYAEVLVQSRNRTAGLSGAALRRELRDKGVDEEVARVAVGALDDETERARAEQLVAKKLRAMGGLDPQVQARRLAAMLARKGYPSGVAYAVVRDAVNAAAEHARD